MNMQTIAAAAALALAACSSPTSTTNRPASSVDVPSPPVSPAEPAAREPLTPSPITPGSGGVDAGPPACTGEQFVACRSGDDCTTKSGVLLTPHTCFDHAADACEELACEHGCNLYAGPPKQAHCAPNASSSSDMLRCAGYSGWICPENMRCEVPKQGRDQEGTCVPYR